MKVGYMCPLNVKQIWHPSFGGMDAGSLSLWKTLCSVEWTCCLWTGLSRAFVQILSQNG